MTRKKSNCILIIEYLQHLNRKSGKKKQLLTLFWSFNKKLFWFRASQTYFKIRCARTTLNHAPLLIEWNWYCKVNFSGWDCPWKAWNLPTLTFPIPIPDKEKKLSGIFIFTFLCGAPNVFMKDLLLRHRKEMWK